MELRFRFDVEATRCGMNYWSLYTPQFYPFRGETHYITVSLSNHIRNEGHMCRSELEIASCRS